MKNPLTLTPHDIHVWQLDLGRHADCVDACRSWLSKEERERADRCHINPRRQFVLTRASLRWLLSRQLDCEPQAVEIHLGPKGKPYIDAATGGRFNVSHSGDMALLAVTLGREVGVDVEQKRNRQLDLAERYFSPRENEALRNLPTAQQLEGFYNAWVRKEAFVKACGQGISYGLQNFDVTLAPNEPAQLLATRPTDEASRWHMAELGVGEGFAAALVVEGGDFELRFRELELGELLH